MNQVAKVDTKETSQRHLLEIMASNVNLDPHEYARTVKQTCGMPKATDEEFIAFLMVARRYDLDPLLKEIYAFPAKGGGIVPIVSIDGWINMVNSHPKFDGMEFDFEERDGKLISCTCTIHRKDRNRPTKVTEFLSECRRNTDPWKMEHRMLRHKSLIQCARYAFGFAGIYDEDEAEKMKDITPSASNASAPPPPPPPPDDEPVNGEIISGGDASQKTSDRRAGAEDVKTAATKDLVAEAETAADEREASDDGFDPDSFLDTVQHVLSLQKDEASVEEAWAELDVEATLTHDAERMEVANQFKITAMKRVAKG